MTAWLRRRRLALLSLFVTALLGALPGCGGDPADGEGSAAASTQTLPRRPINPDLAINKEASYLTNANYVMCGVVNVGIGSYTGSITLRVTWTNRANGAVVQSAKAASVSLARGDEYRAQFSPKTVDTTYDVDCAVDPVSGDGVSSNNSYRLHTAVGFACDQPSREADDPDCWLEQNPTIARALIWERRVSAGPVFGITSPWSSWPVSYRSKLRLIYHYYKDYLHKYPNGSGATDHSPDDAFATQTIPPNQDSDPSQPGLLSDDDAYLLYLKFVGMSLATELSNTMRWSITSYSARSLQVLFDSRELMTLESTGGYRTKWVVPASPIVAREFLNSRGWGQMSSRLAVISAMLDWSRRFVHILTYSEEAMTEEEAFQAYWGYAGLSSPVYGMLNGTYPDASYPVRNAGHLTHFTRGCHYTTAFWSWLLRSMNIPVESVLVKSTAGGFQTPLEHSAAHFLEDDKYLSHSDEPYIPDDNMDVVFGLPIAQAGSLLMDPYPSGGWPGFITHVLNNTAFQYNLGYSAVLSNIGNPTGDQMLWNYCHDLAKGRSHADGLLYKMYFSQYFSVADLEALGLWNNLDGAIASFYSFASFEQSLVPESALRSRYITGDDGNLLRTSDACAQVLDALDMSSGCAIFPAQLDDPSYLVGSYCSTFTTGPKAQSYAPMLSFLKSSYWPQ